MVRNFRLTVEADNKIWTFLTKVEAFIALFIAERTKESFVFIILLFLLNDFNFLIIFVDYSLGIAIAQLFQEYLIKQLCQRIGIGNPFLVFTFITIFEFDSRT
jgi:hypothetical protein